jgi:hypothetical protein
MTTTRLPDDTLTFGRLVYCSSCGKPVYRRRINVTGPRCDKCRREVRNEYNRRRRRGLEPAVIHGPYQPREPKERQGRYTAILTAGTVLVYHAGYRARVVFEYEQYPIEEIRASLAADALPDGVTFHAMRGGVDLGYWRAECGSLVEAQP